MEVRSLYNRYNALTGRYVSLPEPGEPSRRPPKKAEELPPRPAEPESGPVREIHTPPKPPAPRRSESSAPARAPGRGGSPFAGLEALLGGLGGNLNRRLGGLDSEDLLLLAVVYLMYRESGDTQLLIVLAALLLF